jgi:hypothetical protein
VAEDGYDDFGRKKNQKAADKKAKAAAALARLTGSTEGYSTPYTMHHTPCPIHYTNRLYRGVQYTIHYAPYTMPHTLY